MIYRTIDISQSRYDAELLQKAYNAMSNERKQKADRYRLSEDRRRCIFADMLLREILRDSFSVAEPEFYIDENAKPHLKGDNVYFSISHSDNFVACAVSTSPIGIDIEKKRTVTTALIKKVCTEEEEAFVTTNEEETDSRFLRVWCAKEAYLKYTGEGISGGLKSISVADKNGMKTTLSDKLTLHSIKANDYILAIVCEE